MMMSDCDASMKELGYAFGITKMDDNRVASYHNAFQHLDGRAFASLVEWAKQNCDRFPTIKELYRGMYELNLVQRPKLSEMDKDAITVVCTCGTSFVFSRNNPPSTYHCPGDGCHVSYDSQYVRQNMDQYNVLWADVDIRAALHARVPKDKAMAMIYDVLQSMTVVPEKKANMKEVARALPSAPEQMFEPTFDGKDARPNPFDRYER